MRTGMDTSAAAPLKNGGLHCTRSERRLEFALPYLTLLGFPLVGHHMHPPSLVVFPDSSLPCLTNALPGLAQLHRPDNHQDQ